jgi:adenylate cyclase
MPLERKLAAILAADVVGYSRLMGVDETGTVAALKQLRHEVADRCIAAHEGRIANTAGDGLLVEFASVVRAVRCATEMQMVISGRNADVAEDKRIRYRIGINIGDVIVDGHDILGDGVNIAARLQEMAEPDGVWISAAVYEGVIGKLEVAFEDLGERTFKNITRPVRVYRVVGGAGHVAGVRPRLPSASQKPSIAVLAFNNMSGDPEQDFFADGIVEDVTTQVSRLPGFFVIARNSSFTYKGRAVDVRDVAKELGVRYVVEGSVQKAAGRVRVTAQLIEAASGKHIWAERYDRDVKDVFAIQDEITQGIFAALHPHLLLAEAEHAQRKPPENLDAWGFTVRARVKWYDVKRENVRDVEQLCRQAIALEPEYALAHATLGAALGFGSYALVSEDFLAMGREALAESNRAVELDGDNPDVLLAAGLCFYFLGLFHKSNGLLERALELNPNSAMACAASGLMLGVLGRSDEGVVAIERAMKLSPRDPQTYLFQNWLAFCHFTAGRLDEAIVWAERSARAKPRFFEAWIYLAAALAEAGRAAEAAHALDKARQLVPPLRLTIYQRPRTQGTAWQKLVDGLHKAGLTG